VCAGLAFALRGRLGACGPAFAAGGLSMHYNWRMTRRFSTDFTPLMLQNAAWRGRRAGVKQVHLHGMNYWHHEGFHSPSRCAPTD